MPTYRSNARPLSRKWQARIQHDGKRVSLGFYATREEAEEAERSYRKDQELPDWSARAPHNPGGRERENFG